MMSLKRFFLINVITALILVTLITVVYLLVGEEFLESMCIICGALMLSVIWITLLVLGFEQYNSFFDNTQIKAMWGKLVYRKLAYTEITAICICGATYSYPFRPIRDKTKHQKALIVLFDTYFSPKCIGSNMTSVYPPGLINSCSSFFNKDNLLAVIKKTELPIYVTGEMLELYGNQMVDVLNAYPDRFIVAYFDKENSCEKQAPYPIYKLYQRIQENC